MKKTCAECGNSFEAKRSHAKFCGIECKRVYNNRKAIRGSEIYDMFMMLRFERKYAKDEAIWGHMCALASAYKDSDKALRAGRRSYDLDAHKALPIAYSNGQGDGR